MAARVSAVEEVLGRPTEDSSLHARHDQEFIEDIDVESSSSSTSDDEVLSGGAAAACYDADDSDDEENLDALDPADRSTASLASIARESAAKRSCMEPTTLDKISERVHQSCKCGKNCFTLVPTEVLLNLRRMSEGVDSELRETFLAGQLETFLAGQLDDCTGSPLRSFSRWSDISRSRTQAARAIRIRRERCESLSCRVSFRELLHKTHAPESPISLASGLYCDTSSRQIR